MVSKMARDLRFVTQMIFLEENGRPMEFYMKPCGLKKTLLPMIEIGGGTLTSKLTTSETIIRLTDPKKPVEGFVSADFILDSVKKKFLQDINKYRIKSKKSNQEEEVERHQDSENDSNTINRKTNRIVKVVHYEELSDGENSSSSVKTNPKKKKRLKYTDNDDKAILKYIEKLDGRNDYTVHGNSLWKHMAHLKVTKHSWQSMRKHYIDFLHHKKREKRKDQKTLEETFSKGKRTSSAQESESPRKKSKSSESDSSSKEDSSDSDTDVDINLLTPRRRKENSTTKKQPRPVTRGQHKASSSNDDTDNQSQQVVTRGQKKAVESEEDADNHSQGVVTRGQGRESGTTDDDKPLNQRASTRGLKKVVLSIKNQNEQTSDGRAITRSQEKTSDSSNDFENQALTRQGMTRRHKRVIESDASSDPQAVTKRQKDKKVNKVSESEDNQSLPDNNFEEYSQQVPQQEIPVYHIKDKGQHGKPVTKRRYPTRNSNDADSVSSPQRKAETPNRVSDVTMATVQEDGMELDSDVDEFDQRLLAIAEKASFSLSQESQDHDEESEGETSAKDTQEDDEDEFIFRRINRKKRTERNKNQKEKQAVNEKVKFIRVTRQQSSTEKSSTVAQVNSVARVNSKSKNISSTASNYKSPAKSPSRRGKKTEITPETCSRNLFGDEDDDDDENESAARKTKGTSRKDVESMITAQSPDEDNMWHFVKKMAENYRKVERLPCARGMTQSQLLHALFVSDGTVEDTENYIKTGKLTNGASPWSKAENDAILRNERTAVNTIIKKRGGNSVSERGAFLRGCR